MFVLLGQLGVLPYGCSPCSGVIKAAKVFYEARLKMFLVGMVEHTWGPSALDGCMRSLCRQMTSVSGCILKVIVGSIQSIVPPGSLGKFYEGPGGCVQ